MASRGMKKKKKGPNGWKYHSRTRRTKLPICLGRSFLFSDSVLFSFALFRSLSLSFHLLVLSRFRWLAGWLIRSLARASHPSSFVGPFGPPTSSSSSYPPFSQCLGIANNFHNSRLESFPSRPAYHREGVILRFG